MWTELEDELFSLLCMYDRTWVIVQHNETAVVLENAEKCQVYATTLELALREAIDLEHYTRASHVR